jgi:hypothetical protein
MPQRYTRPCKDSCQCSVPSLTANRALSSASLTSSPSLPRLLLLLVEVLREIAGQGEHREAYCCAPIGVECPQDGYGDNH